jgi:segregation and condensation protein B
MTNEERKAALEAIIYAADEPATLEQLASALGEEKLAVQSSLDELIAGYANDERGVEVRAVAGGYKMYTKPQHHEVVRRFIKSLRPPLRLSMPALETLAVIAYKQPVTAPEISEIRGVNTSGVINTLLEKKLITTAGRKEVMGRPILYKSSKEFLMRFGLSDLDELPSLKEFEALAREALGADEGVLEAPHELMAEANGNAASNSLEPLAEKLAEAEVLREEEVTATAEGMPSGQLDEDPPADETATEPIAEAASDVEELRQEEVVATSEGMPSGELDEEPSIAEEPKADAKAAGE